MAGILNLQLSKYKKQKKTHQLVGGWTTQIMSQNGNSSPKNFRGESWTKYEWNLIWNHHLTANTCCYRKLHCWNILNSWIASLNFPRILLKTRLPSTATSKSSYATPVNMGVGGSKRTACKKRHSRGVLKATKPAGRNTQLINVR